MQRFLRARFVCLALWGVQVATTFGQRDADYARAEAKMLQAFERGQFDNSSIVFLPWADGFQKKILDIARKASLAGDHERARQVWRFYFKHCTVNHMQPKSWSDAAKQYVLAIKRADKQTQKEHADDLAALPLWRSIIKTSRLIENSKPILDISQIRSEEDRKRDLKKVEQLAEQLLKQYPRSMFAPAVLRIVGGMRGNHGDMYESVGAYYKHGLKLLEKANAPKRHRIWLLHALGEAFLDDQITRDAYRQINVLTDIDAEKRYARLKLIERMGSLTEPPNPVEVRKEYEKFLTDHPRSFRAATARSLLVRSWVNDQKPGKALNVLREYDQPKYARLAVDADLLRIADYYVMRGKHEDAINLLEEIKRRFPQTTLRHFIHARMGDFHAAQGDRERALLEYRQATRALKQEFPLRVIDDYSYGESTPFIAVAHDHMEQQEWAKALATWKRYEPSSWCGTCMESLHRRRAINIAICKMNQTKNLEQAIKEFQAFDGRADNIFVSQLVEFAQRNGKLEELSRWDNKQPGQPHFGGPTVEIGGYAAWFGRAAKGDYQTMWDSIRRRAKDSSWLSVATSGDMMPYRLMKLLAACGSDAKPFLLQQTKHIGDEKRAAVVALALMQAIEVWPMIRDRLDDSHPKVSEMVAKDYLLAAWMLQTNESKRFIKRIAADRDARYYQYARDVLSSVDQLPVVHLKRINRTSAK